MIQIEGNITGLDQNAKFFVLTDKAGNSVKCFWKAQHEQYMQKQKVGYYEKPFVDEAGKKEAVVGDIFYVPRPEGYPRPQKAKGSYGGKSPEERKDIRLMACLKSATDIWQCPCIETEDELATYEEVCQRIARAAVDMEKILSGEVK